MTLPSCETEDKTVSMKERVRWTLIADFKSWMIWHVEDKLAKDIKGTAKSKQGIC